MMNGTPCNGAAAMLHCGGCCDGDDDDDDAPYHYPIYMLTVELKCL